DFNFYGGIYRDVWLIAANDLHFAITDHASPGIRITTPEIPGGNGSVSIQGTVANDSQRKRSFEIVHTIFDAVGRTVATVRSRIDATPGTETKFTNITPPVKNPKLWSPDSPYLYKARSSIIENGKTLDEISQPLGFRWFNFDPIIGFSLNGQHFALRGTN